MNRILTITSWYPPHHFGGYELSCFDVMTRLEARGHDVRVLCGDERVPGAEPSDPRHELRVHRELRQHWYEASRLRPSLTERVAIERHNHRTLERHLTEFKPDVVSVWHMVAISMGLIRRLIDEHVPIVYVVCDEWPRYSEQMDAWFSLFSAGPIAALLGRSIERVTGLPTRIDDLGSSGTFCFVSDSIRQRVTDGDPSFYPCSTVVYSGIEQDQFPQLTEAPRRPWRWRLVYLGRLDAWKGVDTLLHALKHLPPEATLHCYGRGADQERERLVALARQLGVAGRVIFGMLERHEIAGAYSEADVVVFPSEWREPFGLVPIEAMACGTPVVSTTVGGSAEFLRDGYNCVVFPAGNDAELAAAVRRLYDDEKLRRLVVEGGLKTASELGADELADVLERWHIATAERFAGGLPADRVLGVPAPSSSAEPSVSAVDVSPELGGIAANLIEDVDGLVLTTGDTRIGTPRPSAPRCHVTVVDDDATDRQSAGAKRRVVARRTHLPFRTGAFDAVASLGTLERVADAVPETRELARVVRRGGLAILATSNRDDALMVKDRIRDRIRGVRRAPKAYFHASGNVREYNRRELERMIEPTFRIRHRHPVGWDRGWKSRVANVLVRATPLERFSSGFVLEAEPR